MLTSKGSYPNKDELKNNKKYNRITFQMRRWSLQGLFTTLCFCLVSLPVFASSINNDPNISSTAGMPIWKIAVIVVELIILVILTLIIISDMKVIRWFEKKKRTRL